MVKRIVLLCLAGILVVAAAAAVLIMKSPRRDESMNSKLPISSDLKKILYYASLAPSSHNAQMWQVGVKSDSEVYIMVDRDRLLPEVDPELREAYLSLGAFVENMAQAAESFGYDTDVALLSGETDNKIADIRFTPASAKEKNSSLEAISIRHTAKIPFLSRPLKPDDLTALLSIDPDQVHYYAMAEPSGQYLAQGTVDAMAKQVKNDGKQTEMADWTRISTKEAESARDGITPEMMGIDGVKKLFFKTFFTHDSLVTETYRNQTVATTKKQAENAAGYFVIESSGNDRNSLIQTGRVYERLLLAAAGRRVAIHTMSSMLEESPWNTEMAGKLGLKQAPQFVLRAGYLKDYGKPDSLRRSIDEFTYMLPDQ